MANKYPGYREDDTSSDEYFREKGMMTNREFFTSNAKGGFYEGMEWDEKNEEWIPNAENRAKARERQAEYDAKKCHECDCYPCVCW